METKEFMKDYEEETKEEKEEQKVRKEEEEDGLGLGAEDSNKQKESPITWSLLGLR